MKGEKFTFKTIGLLILLCVAGLGASKADNITINNLGHSSIYFKYHDLIIYIDPYSAIADFDTLPDADYIFVTHEHADHYDLTALDKIKKSTTVLITTQTVKNLGTYTGTSYALANGESFLFDGIWVKAVPAYNLFNTMYHPSGKGNGYVFTFGQKKIYVAGDTENIPEMRMMGPIDVAFLPMSMPSTMTPVEVFSASLNINPHIQYIYHYENSDTAKVRRLLRDYIDIVRIGKSVYTISDQMNNTPNEYVYGKQPEVAFFPNPVRDFLTIFNAKQGSQITLFDMAGKVVLKQQLSEVDKPRIDLSALKKGAYLLKYKEGDTIKSVTLLKE